MLTDNEKRRQKQKTKNVVRTLFTVEGGDGEFANFTLPTLKTFFDACSQNVSGNKE